MPTPSGRPSMMDAIIAGEKVKMTIRDVDICFKEPVKSVIDGSVHANRRQYNEHLRANGCVEIGTDAPKERTEIRGDFGCKTEVADAVKTVLKK